VRWLKTFLGIGEPAESRAARLQAKRWIVLDVETSGLDQRSDALLAIGAVAVTDHRVVVDDSFEIVVQQARASSHGNILVHGIGQQAQLDGVEPRQACSAFLDYYRNSPLVGFHSSFDRAFLARALKIYLGLPVPSDWLDLAGLAPALNPGVKAKALDEWLDHFGLSIDQRHNASADAFVTAMLFLRLLKQVPPQHRSFRHLQKLSLAQRWAGG